MSLFLIETGKEWKGSQKQSFFIARELKKKGYSFIFVVQPQSYLYRKAIDADLPVLPIKMRSGVDFGATLKLVNSMKRNHCVLAHFSDERALTVGSSAANMAQVPLRIVSRRIGSSLKRKIFSKQKYKKKVDRIIAPSEGVKRLLIRGGVQRDTVDVIPYGIDFSMHRKISSNDYFQRELSLDEEKYLVGILSYLSDESAHKHLIQTAKIIGEFTDRIKVVIMSDGPLKLDLRAQTRVLNGNSIVYILGFRENLPRILSSLDIFVLSSYSKGFGHYLLDAMATHLPVVVERAESIPKVVVHGKTGILIPPSDSSYLASTILALYKNQKLAKSLGKKGGEIVQERFSAQSMAERVINLYEKEADRKGILLLKNEKMNIS